MTIHKLVMYYCYSIVDLALFPWCW